MTTQQIEAVIGMYAKPVFFIGYEKAKGTYEPGKGLCE